MSVAVQSQKIGRNNPAVRLVPPWYIEAGFYTVISYDFILAPIFGLEIERLGIVFLAGLASFCILGMRERPIAFFKTLIFPVCLGFSFILIQYMYHGESILTGYAKAFVPWIFTVLVVQALSFRHKFLHRYAIFTVILGMVVLPFLEVRAYGNEMSRVALEKNMGPLSSANAMGEWFGFCTVYFFLFGVASYHHKARLVSWIIATGCLLIETLTVSRAALLATVIGIILGSRDFIKRGFLPIILLLMLVVIAYGTGIFDQSINFYMMRGTQETGRGYIWPRAIDGIINSPLIGVGASNLGIYIPEVNRKMTPHNGFLFIALAAGVIPLIFYTAYWIQAIWAAIHQPTGKTDSTVFLLPLVAYVFLICLFGTLTFLGPSVVVTIAAAVTSQIQSRPIHSRVGQNTKNLKK